MKKDSSLLSTVSPFVPLFLGGLSFWLIFVNLYPGVKTIFQTREQTQNLEEELNEKIIPKRTFLQSLNQDELISDFNGLVVLVPNQPNPTLILATVEALAAELNLKVGSLQYYAAANSAVAQKDIETIDFMSLDFLIEGENQSLLAFVSNLQKAAPLAGVKTISIEKSVNEPAQNTAKLSTRWYYKEIPTQVGSIDEPLTSLTKDEQEAILQVSQFRTVAATAVAEETPSVPSSVEVGKANPF